MLLDVLWWDFHVLKVGFRHEKVFTDIFLDDILDDWRPHSINKISARPMTSELQEHVIGVMDTWYTLASLAQIIIRTVSERMKHFLDCPPLISYRPVYLFDWRSRQWTRIFHSHDGCQQWGKTRQSMWQPPAIGRLLQTTLYRPRGCPRFRTPS